MQRKPILSEQERLETLNWLASDERGLQFLRWLCHDVCNFNVTSIAYEGGVLSQFATIFNDARKDIWRILRPYLLPQWLAEIEPYDVFLDQEALKAQGSEDETETTEEDKET